MTDDEIAAFVATLRRAVLFDVELVLRRIMAVVGEYSPPSAQDVERFVEAIMERRKSD